MNEIELRAAIDDLGITQAEFSRLIEVTPRAISLWLAGEREVPGPVAAYLGLMASLPRALQARELARIRQEDPNMYEGMYKVTFQGAKGTGLGVLVMQRGRVFGSDGGVQYDGAAKPSESRPGFADVQLHLTVPPGVPLVQGVPPKAMSYGFDLECSIAVRGTTPLTVQTPFGPVRAVVEFLREVPA